MESPSAETSSPWDTSNTSGNGNGNGTGTGTGGGGGHYIEPSDITTTTNGDDRPAGFSSGSERGYWKRLESVEVGLLAEREGWFLQKYKVESDVSDSMEI